MKVAIAILTWNRIKALQTMLDSIRLHCPQHQIALFEDAGIQDGTATWMRRNFEIDAGLFHEAVQLTSARNYERCFLGLNNLGVAGNSNRALKWFEQTDCDYLMLCNDDLEVSGDFATLYAKALEDLKVGLLCYCGTYPKNTLHEGPWKVQELVQLTGSMMAIPRSTLQQIGYFDPIFGKFGEEHCDYTQRCRMAGLQHFDGQDRFGLDIACSWLRHQEIPSSINDIAKKKLQLHARSQYQKTQYFDLYRPFSLRYRSHTNNVGNAGISTANLTCSRI